MNKEFKEYFGFGPHSISRQVYVRANFSAILSVLILNVFPRYLFDSLFDKLPLIATIIYFVIAITVSFFAIAVLFRTTEKRVLEIKLNKNLKYLILVPYINILFFIYLCLKK